MDLPRLIQGGMGAGVSGWVLARAVSSLGQLGVVSGTALDSILVRRLQMGDVGGHMRRAIAAFPFPAVGEQVLRKYSRGKAGTDSGEGDAETPDAGARFRLASMPRARMTPDREALVVLANFVEVFLAKEGHHGVVGINYLEKIQFPTLPSLYGAMLAGVDAVLMGAGIPAQIPEAIDRLSRHEEAVISLDVQERGDEAFDLRFDPALIERGNPAIRAAPLRKPRFLPIVSSATLARALLKKAPGGINGFVVEKPIAGGHNAPPRGPQKLTSRGEPIYGERDEVDMEQMKSFGVPFWLAGAYGSRAKFDEARAAGAHGIQVGTAFAFCEESGLDPALRRRFILRVLRGEGEVFTDPIASPTGFPFKVAALEDSLSEYAPYNDRPRLCDLGYLRQAYCKPDGTLDYRCPSEPIEDYLRKGGRIEETVGRKCLCNALLTNIGLGQRRPDGYEELPMLTAGDDLGCVKQFCTLDRPEYHARDVVAALVGTGGTVAEDFASFDAPEPELKTCAGLVIRSPSERFSAAPENV